METQNLIGSRNIKIRSRILDDFLSRRLNDKNLERTFINGFLADSFGKGETLDLDFKSQNDDVSSENSVEMNTPKVISEKHEEESLEDNYVQSLDSPTTEVHGDGIEKNDTPKSENIEKADAGTKDHIQTLERIVKILELSSESTGALETRRAGISIMKSMAIPLTEYRQNSYLIFFFLLMFFILFSILNISFHTLEFLKKYFEKGLIMNWSWMKKYFSISKSEGENKNLFTFLIISPILIIFLISYTGLYILLLLNKVVLDSVPDAIYQKICCRHWFQNLWVKNN